MNFKNQAFNEVLAEAGPPVAENYGISIAKWHGMPRLFNLIFLFFCTLPCPSFAALSFEECKAMMIADKNLTPFIVDPKFLFSPQDFKFISGIFTKYSKLETSTAIGTRGNQVDLVINMIEDIEVSGKLKVPEWTFVGSRGMSESEAGEIKRLMSQMFVRSLENMETHPILRSTLKKQGLFRVHFFGLRYFFEPGKSYDGLHFHRDARATAQSIVVLQRPTQLLGGHTTFAWPNSTELYESSYPGARADWLRKWAPRIGTNRLITFDGIQSFHGTEYFDMSEANYGKMVYRDILSMTISPVEE